GFFNNSHHAWNLAPNGALTRAGDAAGWSAGDVRAAVWTVTAVVLAALWVAVRRTAGRSAGTAASSSDGNAGAGCDTPADVDAAARCAADPPRGVFEQYALGVGATFLVSSVTWSPHLSLAALPAVWLLHAGWSGAARRAPTLLMIGGVAYAVLCLPLGTFGRPEDLSRDIQLKLAACVLLFAATWSLAADEADSRAAG
ncbi:MAG TPA: hypothetical protein VK824_12845, partial [Planctomycetota bacterium]|nr:hypothetical protein [Planctomycetota bacterium]